MPCVSADFNQKSSPWQADPSHMTDVDPSELPISHRWLPPMILKSNWINLQSNFKMPLRFRANGRDVPMSSVSFYRTVLCADCAKDRRETTFWYQNIDMERTTPQGLRKRYQFIYFRFLAIFIHFKELPQSLAPCGYYSDNLDASRSSTNWQIKKYWHSFPGKWKWKLIGKMKFFSQHCTAFAVKRYVTGKQEINFSKCWNIKNELKTIPAEYTVTFRTMHSTFHSLYLLKDQIENTKT